MKNTYNSIRRIICCCCVLVLFICNATVFAQVKIGDNPNAINPASILELESTSRTLVLTRVTDAQMQSISPLEGALVYNIDQQCVFYFNQTIWENLCAQGSEGGGANGATLSDNGDGTYTFTNSNGVTTIITTTGGSTITGQTGSIFFADIDTTPVENNNELFWDNVINRLGIGTNTNLNNKLTVNGSVGISNGSVSAPGYRFSNDANSGIYGIVDDEIGFSSGSNEIMRIDPNTLYLNEAILEDNRNPPPLLIKSKGATRELIGFEVDNLLQYQVNIRGAGLNIDSRNKPNQLFLSIFGHGNVGIGTGDPQQTLDVNGDFRVRNLPNSPGGLPTVTVDSNGIFYRSTSATGKSIATTTPSSGRWTNTSTSLITNSTKIDLPLFGHESFKDGADNVYKALKNRLVIKQSGRYSLFANLALVMNTNVPETPIFVRLHINGEPRGALLSTTTAKQFVSLALNETLLLQKGDLLTVVLYAKTKINGVALNQIGTSSVIIKKEL